jgi:uncharacterized protein YkwD
MLVTFAAIGAVFVVLDTASGLRLPAFSAAARLTSTPTPRPTATPPAPTDTPRLPATATMPSTAAAPSSTPAGQLATATATPSLAPTLSATAAAATPASTATPPPATVTPSATTGATATAPVTATAPATTTATVLPTPPGGITPPIYGTALNYPNNTTFAPAFMATLDKRIIVLTNAQRTAHGLAPLVESGTLDVLAASRSEDLVKRDYFDHYDPTSPLDAQGHHIAAIQELLARNNVPYSEVGENLIGDTGYALDNGTPQQAVQAWMRSPEHRANILHAGYTSIGVGMAAEDQSDGLRVVITQVFLS